MFSYALVNRPAGIGTVPRNIEYSVLPRPASGHPHHDLARHGILVTIRRLTPDELRSFELAPLADDELLARLANGIAVDLGDYAGEYLQESQDDPALFRSTVFGSLERTEEGIRYSIADENAFLKLVESRLRQQTTATHSLGQHGA